MRSAGQQHLPNFERLGCHPEFVSKSIKALQIPKQVWNDG